MSYGQEFVLTLFTNDPALAARADAAGIDRIGIDLDRAGKHLRQNAKNWISTHTAGDLLRIREVIHRAKLFARVDGLCDESKQEIDELLAMGTQSLMLPMFERVEQAARFIDLVNGRAEVSLLVETAAAAARIGEIVRLDGVDEIFIGLNDLHLSLKLDSHFELLTSPLMEMLSATVRGAGIRFGFGGLGRVQDANLPIPSELIYPQYPRLSATSALVSRVFFSTAREPMDLLAEIDATRRALDAWWNAPCEVLDAAHESLRQRLFPLIKKIKMKKM